MTATLYGFVDFNGDGLFDGPSETVTRSVPAGTNGPVDLLFNVPFTATTNLDLGARFRLSTDAALGPNGAAWMAKWKITCCACRFSTWR